MSSKSKTTLWTCKQVFDFKQEASTIDLDELLERCNDALSDQCRKLGTNLPIELSITYDDVIEGKTGVPYDKAIVAQVEQELIKNGFRSALSSDASKLLIWAASKT
jgi:hypothetical protein